MESRGDGYLVSGRPKILFEAYVFSRKTQHKYDSTHPDISSPTWNRALYKGGEKEYERLEKAIALIKDWATIVSLCGSKHLTAQEGYLQFRFGRAGHIELEFPPQRQETQQMFRYAQYSRYQVNRLAVSFQRGGYTYALFGSYEGDTLPKTLQQGVQVTPPRVARKETSPC